MSFQSPRAAERKRIAHDLSHLLVRADDRAPIKALGVDVSRNGLGLVGFEAIGTGVDVILVTKLKGITLRVVWCKPDTVRKGIFHIGLQSNDPAVNLERVLEGELGLTPPLEARPLLRFNDLREAIATARVPDGGALDRLQLSKLRATHHPYPIHHDGKSLLVLLPKDLKPADAALLPEAAARDRNVLVISAGADGSWSKAWPEGALKMPA